MPLPTNYNKCASSRSISVYCFFYSLWAYMLFVCICSFYIFDQMPDNVKYFCSSIFVVLCIFFLTLSVTVKVFKNSFILLRLAFTIYLAKSEQSLLRTSYSPVLRQDPSDTLSSDLQIVSFSNLADGNRQCSKLCVCWIQVFFLLIFWDVSFFALIVSSKTCVDHYSTKPSEAPLQIWSSLSCNSSLWILSSEAQLIRVSLTSLNDHSLSFSSLEKHCFIRCVYWVLLSSLVSVCLSVCRRVTIVLVTPFWPEIEFPQ